MRGIDLVPCAGFASAVEDAKERSIDDLVVSADTESIAALADPDAVVKTPARPTNKRVFMVNNSLVSSTHRACSTEIWLTVVYHFPAALAIRGL
tara:strand:- start:19383 stop:19664 length:282 start_codon:yes stop_codon:yes gene_type:complete